LQFAVLGAIFTVQVLVCFGVVAWTAGWVGEKLRRYDVLRTALRMAAAGVLILLGLLLALAEPLTRAPLACTLEWGHSVAGTSRTGLG
jgi:threonine/homoserine/homoserine lactone efflux protein